ncbi:MarR family winged helix-turn-helix transcriptional regulator [Actinotalea soli]|uniref:MarR family winged helix-turn-helix transcriptional regulator n=1 Tax=Actinotalea soli TaxID=2819234 RepID=UPI0027DAB97D|nr:MarR family winged helix-turn-helix transcriptional regulator [Actinotalea soli]
MTAARARSQPDPSSAPAVAGDRAAGGLEDELGWSLHRVYSGFRASAASSVADVPGGPRGYQVLVAIETDPPSSQLALARRLGIDRTAMTYLVDELESAGLVIRHPDPTDRRIRHVVITAAGRETLAGARDALRSTEEGLLSALRPAEADQLRDLLARVARSTDPAEACWTPPPGD